jgi:phospholipid/cholesterol/gamma-HCH transport system substrate-binding protein
MGVTHAEQEEEQDGLSGPGRIAAAAALVLALLALGWILFGGNDDYVVKARFQAATQMVKGNLVQIGGRPVGTVDKISLTEDSQAAISVTMEEPLREGSSAVIRSTSLSGVANRYISLAMGPDNADRYEEGATITGEDTTAPVDLDQLFNVFRNKQRESLQKFIEGNATVYADKGRLANRAYKFLNPALNSSERLFAEVSRDSVALQNFLVEGSQVFGAIADRRDDLSSLVSNANTALGAVNNQNDALDRSLSALPGTLRQSNTTFVNLRAALDDLDPLVAASKPATRNLAPFLRLLRQDAGLAVPVFSDLADITNKTGANNDLADTLNDLPTLRDAGATAFPDAVQAMDDSQSNIAFLRPYTPDLIGWISKFGQATAYYDANGHYARVSPTASNIYDYNEVSGDLDPIYTQPERQFDDLDFGLFQRCPGGGTQQAADLSNPFLDDGNLGAGDCDPSDLPPGP